jgi:tRNA U34 5-carboxymethylaminomethyl modifying enzyme MnmG/GidA
LPRPWIFSRARFEKQTCIDRKVQGLGAGKITGDVNYFGTINLSNKRKYWIDAVRPGLFGQTQHIQGITQMVILVYVEKVKPAT